jgi:hypothetical protein
VSARLWHCQKTASCPTAAAAAACTCHGREAAHKSCVPGLRQVLLRLLRMTHSHSIGHLQQM